MTDAEFDAKRSEERAAELLSLFAPSDVFFSACHRDRKDDTGWYRRDREENVVRAAVPVPYRAAYYYDPNYSGVGPNTGVVLTGPDAAALSDAALLTVGVARRSSFAENGHPTVAYSFKNTDTGLVRVFNTVEEFAQYRDAAYRTASDAKYEKSRRQRQERIAKHVALELARMPEVPQELASAIIARLRGVSLPASLSA